jgi:hypothetical protein
MPDIMADPPVPPCYSLLFRIRTEHYEWLSPDLFIVSRARDEGGEPRRVRRARETWLFNFGGNFT